jgi:hypothetical protein
MTSFVAQPADILNVGAGHMQAVQAKWGRLTRVDLAEIRTEGDLAARVGRRYSLSPELARRDVEIWAAERRLPRRTT